jgi:hypothetical protein
MKRPDAFFVVRMLALFALVCPGPSPLLGQGAAEQVITGRIVDATGAVTAGAKVTIINVATGFQSDLLTNTEGFYRTPPLKPAEYEVRVSHPGFQTIVRKGVILNLAQTLRLDLEAALCTRI